MTIPYSTLAVYIFNIVTTSRLFQARDDYYRGGQLEGTHRIGANNQSSRSSHHQSAHQFGPAVDCKQLSVGRGGPGSNPVRKHKRPGNVVPPERHHQQHQQHISFSSSEEELRSTSECTSCDEHESEKGKVSVHHVYFPPTTLLT